MSTDAAAIDLLVENAQELARNANSTVKMFQRNVSALEIFFNFITTDDEPDSFPNLKQFLKNLFNNVQEIPMEDLSKYPSTVRLDKSKELALAADKVERKKEVACNVLAECLSILDQAIAAEEGLQRLEDAIVARGLNVENPELFEA